MEGNVFDVFRVLSLVVTWAVPAILVAAIVAFVVLGPAMMLAGVILRSYETIRGKLRRRARAEAQVLNVTCSIDADCPAGFVCMSGWCMPEKVQ